MKPGTPRFVGERLRQSREARGLTAIALAELIGVSRQAVSQYENGPETPAPSVMHRVIEVLRLPLQFFLRPLPPSDPDPIFYRSMASATKAARTRAKSRFDWTRELVGYIRGFVDLPKVNFPAVDLPSDPLAISKEQVEFAAEATRRHWKLGDGPISNIVLLLENNGAIITRQNLAADALDAFSMWPRSEAVPYVVLNSEKGVAVRSRFDIAHELGHLVMHRFAPPGCLTRPELFDVVEQQADAFASAFLMPARTFSDDAVSPSLDGFRALKPKWRVSIQAMIFRARELNLMSAEKASRMWPNLARRGWRKTEPLDDTLEPEQPRLLRRSLELILNSGAATRQDMLMHTALSFWDVEELIGLPRDYLNPEADGSYGIDGPPILRFPSAGQL